MKELVKNRYKIHTKFHSGVFDFKVLEVLEIKPVYLERFLEIEIEKKNIIKKCKPYQKINKKAWWDERHTKNIGKGERKMKNKNTRKLNNSNKRLSF